MPTDKTGYVILVVEDNPGDFALVEEYLNDKFDEFTLLRATHFKEAKEILLNNAGNIDIVILDISLPDQSGATLIKEILELCLNTPVIVLTGYSDFAFGVKSLSLGISDYILKDELTSLVLYKSIIYSFERKNIILALETSKKEVRRFANQLNSILEEERLRIAREIHDDLGQQLSGLKMSLSILKKFTTNNPEMEPILDGMTIDVNNSIKSLRTIANELRPVIIDKLGLFAAIEWLAVGFEKKTGVICKLHIPALQPDIDKAIEINIFRIFQEVLTNVTKHANATIVNINIERRNQQLFFRIADNGIGIEATTMNKPFSMGLLNIKERANQIAAGLDLSSSPTTGTAIELVVNLSDEKNINS